VAVNGDNSDPTAGGLMTSGSAGSFTTQIGYAGPQFALAAAWRYGQCGQPLTRRGTQFARQNQPCSEGVGTTGVSPFWSGNNSSNNFALTAAWQPKNSGWVPSLSAGWGISSISSTNYNGYNASSVVPINSSAQPFPSYGDVRNISQMQSWQVGLQWNDLFAKGNSAGFSVGQPSYVTALAQNGLRKPYGFSGSGRSRAQNVYMGFYDSPNGPNDGNFAWEWWYRFRVSNNISVTPAIFYLSRPAGQFTEPRRDQQRVRWSGSDPVPLLMIPGSCASPRSESSLLTQSSTAPHTTHIFRAPRFRGAFFVMLATQVCSAAGFVFAVALGCCSQPNLVLPLTNP